MKHRHAFLALLLCGLLALTGCSPNRDRDREESRVEPPVGEELVALEDFIRLDGSTANLPLLRALTRYYTGISEEQAELEIAVSTTDYAYYALLDGRADLLVVYEASHGTAENIQYYDVEMEMKPVGLDALVFLCNEDNPVDSLTTQEIQAIYRGELTNWSEVGGQDVEIVPYQRNEESGSQTLMRKLVMPGGMMDAPSELAPGAMSGLVDQILEYRNDANALGYSVYYYVQNMYALPGIKLLGVDGVQPSNESIGDGSYPFVNEFYAVIRADEPADSLARQVYDFLTTPEGKELIQSAGYVSVP